MPNIMMDFKRFLQLLSPEEQLYEINYLISDISNLITRVKMLIKNFAY